MASLTDKHSAPFNTILNIGTCILLTSDVLSAKACPMFQHHSEHWHMYTIPQWLQVWDLWFWKMSSFAAIFEAWNGHINYNVAYISLGWMLEVGFLLLFGVWVWFFGRWEVKQVKQRRDVIDH